MFLGRRLSDRIGVLFHFCAGLSHCRAVDRLFCFYIVTSQKLGFVNTFSEIKLACVKSTPLARLPSSVG